MPEITTSAPAAPAATPAPASTTLVIPTRVPPAPATPTTTATVDIDAEEVGKWAKLSRQAREVKGKLTAAEARARELEAKVAELEGLKPSAEKAGAVEKLIKEGKLVEAMQAAGADLEKAFQQWVEAGEGAPAAAGPPKELLELQAKYDAIEARLKAEDEAKAKGDEAEKAAAAEAGKAAAAKGLVETIATDAARWARCAKAPEEAAADALEIAVEKVRLLGRAVTDAEAKELFEKALDQAEAGYKALGEKFYVPEAPVRKRSATVAPDVRDYLPAPRESSPVAERKPAVTLDGQRGALRATANETKGKLTEAEAKAKALDRIRALKRGT